MVVEVSYFSAVNESGIVDELPEFEAARSAAANDCGAADVAAGLERCLPEVLDTEEFEDFRIEGGIAELEDPLPQPAIHALAASKPRLDESDRKPRQ